MSLLHAPRRVGPSVRTRQRHDRVTWLLGYGSCLLFTAVIGLVGVSRFPATFPLALLLLLVGCAVMLFRPVVGLYLIAFLSFIGDYQTVGSYPFTKNLSSRESLLFVSTSLSLSPLELWMVLLLAGWVLHMAGSRNWTVRRGTLFWPIVVFTAFLLFGLGVGLSRGGDQVIALSELRPMLYLVVLYPLATNMLTTRAQFVRLFNMVLAGIVVNALLSYRYIRSLPPADRLSPEALLQHSTALIMNLVLVLFVALRLFHGGSRLKRFALFVSFAPILFVYLEVKRRAAIVGLLGGGLVLLAVLYWTNRRRFARVAPVLVIGGAVYVAAFWNSGTVLGFPAQAVKTVIAPDSINERDRASNQYRDIETFDAKATIRSSPLTGIGFGKPFLTPIPLPAIADFQLAKYVTHNSVLWVWMKAGVGGFVAMLFLFGTAMRTGARAALRTPRGEYAAITATSTAFVLMYGVFTYVDISWDVKPMVLLALAMAQIDSVALLPEDDAAGAVPAGAAADRRAELVPAGA